jgi:hypothetical protein
MPVAHCLIRPLPHYRRDAFCAGLEKLGFKITSEFPGRNICPGDVLVVWNRHGVFDTLARKFEATGNPIIVAENGYVGDDESGRQLYSLARTHHNGAGAWHVGEADRWSSLGIETFPWRKTGDHILILPQRGIGPKGVAMPRDWVNETVASLMSRTKRPIKVRPHPGKHAAPPLDPDLTNAWCVVTWGSTAALKAIVAGIPVFYGLEKWIGAPAAKFGLNKLEDPFVGDRGPMLHRLGWAQWRVEEIATGEPFRCLLA